MVKSNSRKNVLVLAISVLSCISFFHVLFLFAPFIVFAEQDTDLSGVQIAASALPVEASSSPTDLTTQSNVSVRIEDNNMQPSAIVVAPGTTVVWINSASQEVRLRFVGKTVSTTCKAPRRFAPGAKGIIQSEDIGQGEVASLCFIEPNEYSYQIEFLQVSEKGDPEKGDTVQRKISGAVRVAS